MGAEITKKMELGLLSKGLCAGILKLGRTVNAYLHHSFGDNNDVELPHITGPLWSAIDRLVITAEGQPAPQLGAYTITITNTITITHTNTNTNRGDQNR